MKRLQYSEEELRHGEAVFKLIETLPQESAGGKAWRPDSRPAAWAARALILRALGTNSRAETRPDQERDWATRLELLREHGEIRADDVRGYRMALRAALVECAASWAMRGASGGDAQVPVAGAVHPILLPEDLEARREEWAGVVEQFMRRNLVVYQRVRERFARGEGVLGAFKGVRLVGAVELTELVLEMTYGASGASDARAEARREPGHYCRLCGDGGCAVHCPRAFLGNHRPTRRRERVACRNCGRSPDPGSSPPTWTPPDGDPRAWSLPPPPTEGELAFLAMLEFAEQSAMEEEAK